MPTDIQQIIIDDWFRDVFPSLVQNKPTYYDSDAYGRGDGALMTEIIECHRIVLPATNILFENLMNDDDQSNQVLMDVLERVLQEFKYVTMPLYGFDSGTYWKIAEIAGLLLPHFSPADKEICANYRNAISNGQDNNNMKSCYPIYLMMLVRNGFGVNKYVMFLKKYIACISAADEDDFTSYLNRISMIGIKIVDYKHTIASGNIKRVIVGQQELNSALVREELFVQNIFREGGIDESLYLAT